MHRRRFMFNGIRWLWYRIVEIVVIKCRPVKAPTIPTEIKVDIDGEDNDIGLTANDVSDINIIRDIIVRRRIDLQARLRADPVFIRYITVIGLYKPIMSPAKLCKFVRDITVRRVSKLIMCFTYFARYHAIIIPARTSKGIKADTVGAKAEKHDILSDPSVLVNYSDTLKNVSISSLIPGDTHYVKMASWIDPILEDGVLTILQAYDAVQTGDSLEVR